MSKRPDKQSPAPTAAPENPEASALRRKIHWGAAIIAGGALLAYANTFSAPFIFDDQQAIVDNPSIRSLSWQAFVPPLTAAGATGRPLVNFSLAVNYAISGKATWSYHALNLFFHVAAAWLLFGLVRRLLLAPVLREKFAAAALPVGFVTALLWAVHPLLTESVTCIIQRNELMVALCYLSVLYCGARANDSPAPRRWLIAGFVACLLGVFCKEVMASAPLLAFACQALLIDGSWRTAWQRRGKFFLSLALCWIPLAFLVIGHNQRDSTVGFGLGITPWEYALTQCRAILLYLKLSFWPHPLIVDYGTAVAKSAAEVWWQGFVLLGFLATTVLAWRRKWPWFFPALLFWALLAPSSSFIPLVTQTVAEHRMYLPLACVLSIVVASAWSLAGRRALQVAIVVAAVFAGMTFARNRDYRSEIVLWQDTAAKLPTSARAHTNLGGAYALANRPDEAMRSLQKALEVNPNYAGAHFNIGGLLDRLGKEDEALAHYRETLRIEPKNAQAHYNLGIIHSRRLQWADAEREFKEALKSSPDNRDAHTNLANVFVAQGRHADAIPHFETAVKSDPEIAPLQLSLATSLSLVGRTAEAIEHFQAGLALDSNKPDAHFRLGVLLMKTGKRSEALSQYREAIRLKPDYAEAHFALSMALLQSGHRDEGTQELETTLQLHPDFPGAKELLDKLHAHSR